MSKKIERAHRVHNKGTPSNKPPPYLVAKMVIQELSERAKSTFIQENQNGQSQFFV